MRPDIGVEVGVGAGVHTVPVGTGPPVTDTVCVLVTSILLVTVAVTVVAMNL